MDNSNNDNHPKQQPSDQPANLESLQEQQFDHYQQDTVSKESGSTLTPPDQGDHLETHSTFSPHVQPGQSPIGSGQPPPYAPTGQPGQPGQPGQQLPMGSGQLPPYAPPAQQSQPGQPGQSPIGSGQLPQYVPPGQIPQPGYVGAPPPKNKKKRNLIIILIIVAVLVLAVAAAGALYFFTCVFGNHTFAAADCNFPEECTRCGETQGYALGHKWKDASCQHPRTCSVCGETRGKTIDHQWLEATCELPKTCELCGATEGEPSGHTWADGDCLNTGYCIICNEQNQEYGDHNWIEANYQSGKTCTLCGEIDGEPLMPSFVFYNLYETPVYIDNSVSIATICHDNNDYQTIGTIYITDNYTTDEVIGYEPLEGYEWIVTEFLCEFSDENVNAYGVEVNWNFYDYYDHELFKDSGSDINITDFSYSVNYLGGLWHDCIIKETDISDEWIDNYYFLTLETAIRVPTGYDGAMIGFVNKGMPIEDDILNEIISYDTVFFRHTADRYPQGQQYNR